MSKENIGDLLALVAVVREGSFTRAAATLGISQSGLSHRIRALESRMGLRLLARTTRSVSPTEAGERVLRTVAPRLAEIEEELKALADLRDKPAGTVRITATDVVADTLLWPRLRPLLAEYPDIRLEIATDYRLTDIVENRFDLGVRGGGQVARDMIAVRIAPDIRRMVVGAPAYFERHPAPQTPEDLLQHNCVSLRLLSGGGLYAWEFRQGERELQVRVDGQLVFNNSYQVLRAALDGVGLAFSTDTIAAEHVQAGRLTEVLRDWSIVVPGYHLYYPNRRQLSRPTQLVIDALRHRS
ncbi:MAG: LysR family transcriptional regulator [Hydrogenophaga sp.]|nr:LysR family transcriptional regulator [Hydrogenophaga sp.]